MTPEQFFDNFAHIAEAPKGVQKLRELILQLAVKGKLVPQDPNDEPAVKLLERIQIEKARLFKEKKIRKTDPLPSVKDDEVPYDLPLSWELSRLGNTVQIIRGITFPSSEKSKVPELGRVACLRTSNVQSEIEWDDLLYISKKYISRDEQMICDSDIVMSMANSRELVGKVALIKNPCLEATFGGFLGVIRPIIISPRFLLIVLKSPSARAAFIDGASQTTNIANISLAKLNPYIFPVPPLAEQHRIVAKVDQLMALCDELEAKQEKMCAKLTRLNNSAINRLLSAREQEEFAGAWGLIRDNFDLFYTTPDSISKLRQAILQLAVQGKLVPQDPNDEPVSVLLANIKAEKERLMKEKKIRKVDHFPVITDDETPYALPHGWEWVRFGTLVESMTNGLYKPESFYTNDGVPSLRMYNIKDGKIVYEKLRKVMLSDDEILNYKLNHNDILLNRVNSLELIGKAAIFNNTNSTFVFESMNIRIRLIEKTTIPLYANTYLMASHVRDNIRNSAKQAIGQSSVNQSQIANLLFPVPPLVEQSHIVAKVDQLMALCDRLEAQLTKSQLKAVRLTMAAIQTVMAAC